MAESKPIIKRRATGLLIEQRVSKIREMSVYNLNPFTSIFKLVFWICPLIISSFFTNCNRQNTAWKGTIKEINGLTTVINPKEPMFGPDILKLEEDLSIGAAEGPDNQMFTSISDVKVNENGDIFILDHEKCVCYVFDRKGSFLRSFGGQGQGPGELNRPSVLHFCPNNQVKIFDYGNKRFATYTSEGKFLRNISIPGGFNSSESDSMGGILGRILVTDKEFDTRWEVQKFTPELGYEFTLASIPGSASLKTRIYNLIYPLISCRFNSKDQIVFAYPKKYEIKIYDQQGKLIKIIQKPSVFVEVPQDARLHLEKLKLPGFKMVIADRYPAFTYFRLDENDWIYVSTYKKVSDSICWDVFDKVGRYYARIHLNVTPFVIRNSYWYCVKINEDGYQFVKRYRARWNTL